MWETRASLVCGLIAVLLLGWLVSNRARDTRAHLSVTDPSADIEHIRRTLDCINQRLVEIGATHAGRERRSGLDPEGHMSSDANVHEQIAAIRLSIQSLANRATKEEADRQTHNLEEIRRLHPVTNWVACSAMLQRALAEPGARDASYLDSGKSETLKGLLMLRPRQLLEVYGAPSLTKNESGRFVWEYHSPHVNGDGATRRRLEFTFDKGYVWNVFIRLD